MAGFLRRHGVMVSLAFSLIMAVPQAPSAAGAEPGNHDVGLSGGRDVVASDIAVLKYSSTEESMEEHGSREGQLHASEFKNPSRLFTDGVNEGPLDASGRPEKQHVDTVLPQPETMEKPAANAGIFRSEQATAPADGPSPSGSTSLAVSFLTFVGVALLGLLVA